MLNGGIKFINRFHITQKRLGLIHLTLICLFINANYKSLQAPKSVNVYFVVRTPFSALSGTFRGSQKYKSETAESCNVNLIHYVQISIYFSSYYLIKNVLKNALDPGESKNDVGFLVFVRFLGADGIGRCASSRRQLNAVVGIQLTKTLTVTARSVLNK